MISSDIKGMFVYSEMSLEIICSWALHGVTSVSHEVLSVFVYKKKVIIVVGPLKILCDLSAGFRTLGLAKSSKNYYFMKLILLISFENSLA